jgi:hypothetical protein
VANSALFLSSSYSAVATATAKKHEECSNTTESHVDSYVVATIASLGTDEELKDIKRNFFLVLMDIGRHFFLSLFISNQNSTTEDGHKTETCSGY